MQISRARWSWLAGLTGVVVGGTAYFLLLGCGGAQTAPREPTVVKVHGGGYGKGLFLVEPKLSDEARERCRVEVTGRTNEDERLSCEADYLVACDVTTPVNKPFCRLVREEGVGRVSLYPQQGAGGEVPQPVEPYGTPPPATPPATPPPAGGQ